MRSLGVDSDCLVVLYDHGEKDISLMTATFVWWAFKVPIFCVKHSHQTLT